ncbi:MAG: hypothetical protein M1830_010582 [Pleopsidium flavum]|nr:MAG: hypothetical protein M1830_010582 [Pleopsidium flavum]
MPDFQKRHETTSAPHVNEWGNSYRYHFNSDHPDYHANFYHNPSFPQVLSNIRSIQRPRCRWPPSPSAEEEVVALAREYNPEKTPRSLQKERDGVVLRGTVDQEPIILEVTSPASHSNAQHAQRQTDHVDSDWSSVKTKSSSDSLGPRTPLDAVDTNHDRRYIYIPQEGIEFPNSYGDAEPPKRLAKPPQDREVQPPRGRKNITRLNTNLNDTIDQSSIDSSRREPSPYAYTRSSDKARYSGDYFLSPGAITPGTYHLNPQNDFNVERSGEAKTTDIQWDGHSRCEGRRSSRYTPARPPVVRHASAMADPGSRVRIDQKRHLYRQESSSDESELFPNDSASFHGGSRSRRYSFEKSARTYSQKEPALRGHQARESVKDQIPSLKRRTMSPPRRTSSTYDGPVPPTRLPPPSAFTPRASLDLDEYFSSNLSKHRTTAYKPSPTTSPYSSPPRSPKLGVTKVVDASLPNGRRSRPSSRPASPLAMHPQSQHSPRLDPYRNTRPYPPLDGPRSQRSSPLPSPVIDRPTAKSGPRIDVQAPSPANTGRSKSYAADGHARPNSRRPSPTPFLSSHSLRSPGIEQGRRSTSDAENKKHVSTPGEYFDMPRSRSRPTTPVTSKDLDKVSLPLPACPRQTPIAGRNDWHTLLGRPNLNVCPSCIDLAVGPEHKAWFVRSPPRPHGYKTRCDFSVPWVRIAWLQMIKEKRQKPDILYVVASIAEQPCPGKMGAIRPWHYLPDPDTGRPISNFDVCSYCVRVVEAIFPSLRGIFQYTYTQNPMQKRACDLNCDSKRFASQIYILEAIAIKAETDRRPPRMHRFADHARRMASTRECSNDDMVLGQAWHIMPQIPQFTVCEECYDEMVWPAIEAGSHLAAKFNRSLQVVGPGGVSCQLYSPRMRQVFVDAVRRNDLEYLRQYAIGRYSTEQALQARHAQAQAYGDGKEIAKVVQEWKNWE